MDAAGVLTMTTADGSTFTADIGALIKTYEFEDSGTVEFQVRTDENGAKHIKADIIEGSIDGSKLTPDYLAQLTRQAEAAAANATAAAGSATTATQNKEAAEAWAAGTIDGQPVPESNPAYHNNAKYWSEQAPKTTFAGLNDVDVSGVTNGQVPVYNADSGKWEPGAGGGGGGTAESVTYDNTETHLEADNVQEAIDAVFTSVSNGKAIIAEAITDKGIETSAADTFATMAQHIAEIEGSGGAVQHDEYYGNAVAIYNKIITAAFSGIFRGAFYSFTNTGFTIKKNGEKVEAIFDDVRSSYHHYSYYKFNVEEGDSVSFEISNTGDNSFCLSWYINGSLDLEEITATPEFVAQGKYFYDNTGTKREGEVPLQDTHAYWINEPYQPVILPKGLYYNEPAAVVAINENDAQKIIPENIKKGVSILGMEGSLEGTQWAKGIATASTGTAIEVNCGFRPKYLMLVFASTETASPTNYCYYDESISGSTQYWNGNAVPLPYTNVNRIGNITNTGFTFNKISSTTLTTIRWTAIG